MSETISHNILLSLDYFGTFIFAIAGAFRAVKYELDLLGVIVLAAVTGVGGGMIRDVFLGQIPPGAFLSQSYLFLCIFSGLLVFWAAPRIARRWDLVKWSDALGLGVFTALGCAKGAEAGLGVVGVVFMGTLTACGGGVIRDILVREIPAVLHNDFYASAAIAGGLVFSLLSYAGVSGVALLAIIVVLVTGLRLLALRFGIHLPRVRSMEHSPSELARRHRNRG